MRRHPSAIAFFVLALFGCASTPSPGSPVPGRGALAIQVIPNPIVASLVSGTTYAFPFEVVVREVGGRAVDVTRISATVLGPGGFAVGREVWDADTIRSMDYPTTIPAHGELRYRFSPRKQVPDERLFGNVAAELRVEGIDSGGVSTHATITVTATK